MIHGDHDEIAWSEDGTNIVVRNAEKLAQVVLPRYFNHNQYASWVRALNAYDFRKTGSDRWRHPSFLRGRPDLLPAIRRKPAVRPQQGGASTRGVSADAVGMAQSNVLVHTPKRSLDETSFDPRRPQLWMMQQEVVRLESELAAIRHEEFEQRFDTVRGLQMMLTHLKLPIAPIPAPCNDPRILLNPEVLSTPSMHPHLGPEPSAAAFELPPPTTRSDSVSTLPSLPSVPSTSRQPSFALSDLELSYHTSPPEITTAGAASTNVIGGVPIGGVPVGGATMPRNAPASSLAPPVPMGGAVPVGAAGPMEATNTTPTLECLAVLSRMPQLPRSTAQLPPPGTVARQQIEAAIEYAFQQLTIGATTATDGGVGGGVYAGVGIGMGMGGGVLGGVGAMTAQAAPSQTATSI
jgi:hypothetical protein